MSRMWRPRSRTSSGAMPPETVPTAPAGAATGLPGAPAASIVIPVFNEEGGLPQLHARIRGVLDALDRPAEVIYIDDGSSDRSLEELLVIQAEDHRVTVVSLARNAGQHAAVLAGFAHARGAVVVTLDADLQNPPEEIPRLLAAVDAGHDVVGTWREDRADPALRRAISAAISRLISWSVGVRIRDCGSMLRAYRRDVVNQLVRTAERAPFLPVLAASVAQAPIEISSAHAPRLTGRSRYSLLRFIRLRFDVVMAYQDIGWVCLDELLALDAEIALVVTHPDDPGERIWFRSVADRARAAGVPLLVPPSVNAPEVVAAVARIAPDFLFSFYVREIITTGLLSLARRGALNLHGS